MRDEKRKQARDFGDGFRAGYLAALEDAARACEAERERADKTELVNAELNVEVSRLYACRNELQDVTNAMDDTTINNTRTLRDAVVALRAERDALLAAIDAARK